MRKIILTSEGGGWCSERESVRRNKLEGKGREGRKVTEGQGGPVITSTTITIQHSTVASFCICCPGLA